MARSCGRQLAWFGLGGVALLTVASLDYRRIVRAAPALYGLGLGALVAVLLLGRTVSGARRWIGVGSFTIQPSEMFKVVFVLMAVWVLTSRLTRTGGLGTLGLTLGALAIPFVLIVKQPDLGTALVLVPVVLALLLGAGATPPAARRASGQRSGRHAGGVVGHEGLPA